MKKSIKTEQKIKEFKLEKIPTIKKSPQNTLNPTIKTYGKNQTNCIINLYSKKRIRTKASLL